MRLRNFGKFQTHVEVQFKELRAQLQNFIASFATHSSGGSDQESSIGEHHSKDEDGAVVQTYVVPQLPVSGGF